MVKRQRKTTVKKTRAVQKKKSEDVAVDGHFLLTLSEKNTGEDIPAVVDTLLENRSQKLIVDAGKVERMETPFVEALLATSKLWSTDGYSIEFKNVSKPFEEILGLLGLSVSNFEVGGVVK